MVQHHGRHAGGLRYHGAGVIASQLLGEGLIEAVDISAAITEALECKKTGESKTILFCLSGHGLIDMTAYDQFLAGNLTDQ